MAAVNAGVEHREAVQRVTLQTPVDHQPAGEGLDRTKIVVAGLDTQALFPQVGQEALHISGFDLADTAPTAGVDEAADFAGEFHDIARRVVLTLLAFSKSARWVAMGFCISSSIGSSSPAFWRSTLCTNSLSIDCDTILSVARGTRFRNRSHRYSGPTISSISFSPSRPSSGRV